MSVVNSPSPYSTARDGFSLVEVVLALGIIAFGILAIIGVLPVALSTGRDAQNETRAAQIAQDIITSVVSQAQTRFPNASILQPSSNFGYDVDLSKPFTYQTLGSDNDGNLVAYGSPTDAASFPYRIHVRIDPDPPGYDPGTASKVTVRVAWQPFAENSRDFVRVITKF